MPSFFNGLTQAAASYLKLVVDAGKNLVSGGEKGAGVELSEAAGDIEAPRTEGESPVLDFITKTMKLNEDFFDPSASKLTENEPRALGVISKILAGRLGNLLPRGDRSSSGRLSIEKLFAALYRGLGLEGYRPQITEGRIVGKHSKFYLLLSYLNEFVNPREGGPVDINAYFRDPIDPETNRIIKWLKLESDKTSEAAPLVAGTAAKRVKSDPDYLRKLAQAGDKLSTVDRAVFLKVAQEYFVEARRRMMSAAEDLAAGRITFKQYRRTMVSEIKRSNLAQVILSIGGVGNLTDTILANVKQGIQRDIQSLDEHIADMQSRGQPMRSIMAAEPASKFPDVPELPEEDSIPKKTIASALTSADPEFLADVDINVGYAEEGVITVDDIETAGKFSSAAANAGQQQFSQMVGDNANEDELWEVRRLEEGVENCSFCITWADKPMPPGQLPAIGEGCLAVIYNKGDCHCVMDTADPEEVAAAKDDA